jgi:hypothetical protein
VSIPPAWHPDPTGRHDHRWWDGTRWTEHVADAGVSGVDPIDQAGPSGEAAATGSAGGGAAADAAGQAETDQAGFTSPGGEAWTTGTTGGTEQSGPGAGQPSPGGWGSPGQAGVPGGTWGSAQPAAAGQGWPTGPTGQGPGPDGESKDGLAIAAGVIGIASIPLLIVFLLGGLTGVVAIVLGAVGMSRVKKSGRRGRGMAITGLITGIVAVALAVLLVVFGMSLMRDFDRCVEMTDDPETCRQISEVFGAADLRAG